MSIDKSIWGLPDTWIDVLHGMAKTAARSNWGLVVADKIPLNDIVDNSPCYCGAVGNFYICRPIVFLPDQLTKSLYPVNDVNNWFFVHYKQESGNTDTHKGRFTDIVPQNRFSEWSVPELPDYLSDYRVKTIFNLQLNKLLFGVNVFCQATNDIDDTVHKYTLGEYINNYKNDYPYVTGVSMFAMYNSSDTTIPLWSVAIDNIDYSLYAAVNSKFSDEYSAFTSDDFTSTYSLWGNEITLMGLVAGVAMTIENSLYFRGFPVGADNNVLHYIFNNDHTKVKYCRLYNDDVLADIYKQCAYLGVFFVGDGNFNPIGTHLQLTDNNVFLGTIDNGLTYGAYTRGAANADQPQFTWDDTGESKYNPLNPPEPDYTSVPSTFNSVSLSDGLKKYVFDSTNLQAFGNEMFDIIDTSDPDALIQNQTLTNFLTNNPLDCIVSVKRFPLPDMSQGTSQNPVLGKVTVPNCLCKPFTSDTTVLTCGTFKIRRIYGNFLDYLSEYVLTLPFCGTVSLDAATVTGKTIEIKYSIDYNTGSCTAWILAPCDDNGEMVVIDSANGNCAVDIPVSGVQTATLTGEIYNANENLKTSKFNGIINGVSNGVKMITSAAAKDFSGALTAGASIVNSVHNAAVQQWNIDNTQVPFKMIGASTSANSMQLELIPRLTVYRPVIEPYFDLDSYLHCVGAAVCHTTTIENYTGYAEITNVDLSGFNATEKEKQMIAAALAAGVYL